MEKIRSANSLCAVLLLALLMLVAVAVLVPAVSAQSGDSQNQINSESPYTESKFELATTDVPRDTAFYAKLGFSVVAKTSYGYVTLKSGPVVIALSPVAKIDSHDSASLSKLRRPPVGVEIVLYTTGNLEEKHARLRNLGLNPTDIQLQPWGVRDFRLTDPGGYYIRISEGHAIPAN
jgi:hypothetical protein